ncbi:MAG: hypothetical protein DI532_05150 [Azospirillum brasilense]|uniref:Lipoprotein n=1 Tax=Roseomonas gilardii TaxID=257708 RepID=A0A1L7AEU9_9PROT|nr:hypothetical protein [Roseomonas gilardii]APT57345.1 hypothetical protein RGI145_09765 [Roseomonas gilardii]PZR16508.1 MAG: hypothetical protein DI532_05150 [Azospirillum brasilense]
MEASGRSQSRLVRLLLLTPLLGLGACQSLLQEGTADVAGIGGAALATAVTDNGAVATGIGFGVRAVAQAGLQYAFRKAQHSEQQAIADAAGPVPLGQVADWKVVHDTAILPDQHGKVTVVREIGGQDLRCREIIFSVEEQAKQGVKQEFFTAAICRNKEGWSWASAEPATERWGALQ